MNQEIIIREFCGCDIKEKKHKISNFIRNVGDINCYIDFKFSIERVE